VAHLKLNAFPIKIMLTISAEKEGKKEREWDGKNLLCLHEHREKPHENDIDLIEKLNTGMHLMLIWLLLYGQQFY
jgi:hypothetical protein